MTVTIVVGNCLEKLRAMPPDSVHVCVSSPPYWGLRNYQVAPTLWSDDPDCVHEFADEEVEREIRKGAGLEELSKRYRGGGKKQGRIERFTIHRGTCVKCGCWRGALGLEPTPDLFVEHLADVYDEVCRVLRPDGTCWVNIGDSYASGGGAGDQGRDGDRFARAHTQKYLGVNRGGRSNPENAGKNRRRVGSNRGQRGDGNDGIPFAPIDQPNRSPIAGLKAKDMVGVPWMLAFELRRRGWYLRQEIIWAKPNPMPESIEDRCTKSHEHVFLLAKREQYFYDAEAIKEAASENTHARTAVSGIGQAGRLPGVTPKSAAENTNIRAKESWHASTAAVLSSRNKRTVWTVATQPFKEAHFATFPPTLIEPCVKAGTSHRGCCPKCRAPWGRVSAPTERYLKFLGRSYFQHPKTEVPAADAGYDTRHLGDGMMKNREANQQNEMLVEGIVGKESETIGWYPTCGCDGLERLPAVPPSPRVAAPDDAGDDWELGDADKADLELRRAAWRVDCAKVYARWREMCRPAEKLKTAPAVVLDPFLGAGTTALVADRLGRDCVGIELSLQYSEIAKRRLQADMGGLFSQIITDDEALPACGMVGIAR